MQGPVAYRVGVSGRHLVYDVFAVTRCCGGLLEPHSCRRSLQFAQLLVESAVDKRVLQAEWGIETAATGPVLGHQR